MREIEASRNMIVIIDDADYDNLSQHKWHISESKSRYSSRLYAATRIAGHDGKRVKVSMHRMIMGFPPGMDVDHINHNGLDNTRSNLRICTRSENLMNQWPRTSYKGKPVSSKHKGVSWSKQHGKWEAGIGVGGKYIHLGLFPAEEIAAAAYAEASGKYHAAFSRLHQKNKRTHKGLS